MDKGSSDRITDKCRSARNSISAAREHYIEQILSGDINDLDTNDTCGLDIGDGNDDTSDEENTVEFTTLFESTEQQQEGSDEESPTEVPEAVFKDKTKNYKYPFENLVLESGGAKGIANCGLIKVLEEHGILQQMKRFAGTSAGAITAALLAVGYNSYDAEKVLGVDFKRLVYDSSMLKHTSNLLPGYGVNTGIRFHRFIGDLLALKTGNPDVTFEEVYVQFKKELCLVVVNVDTSEVKYCHVKTTPDMPVRLAVRMSMSLPVLFQAVKHKHSYCDDGGLLCTYPIHCFDGWFLSMEIENAFFNRIKSLHNLQKDVCFENRFKYDPKNKTTLGGMVFCDGENNSYRKMLEQSTGVPLGNLPNTALARIYTKGKAYGRKVKGNYGKTDEAAAEFYKVIRNREHNGRISKDNFMVAFNEPSFTDDYKTLLFGDGYDSETAWVAVNKYGHDELQFRDITSFIESIGVSMLEASKDHERKDTSNLSAFSHDMIHGLSESTMQPFFKSTDVERSVGINTWYVQATTFILEEGDKQFLTNQGRGSTRKFLEIFLKKNDLEKLTEEEMKDIVIPTDISVDRRKLEKIIDL